MDSPVKVICGIAAVCLALWILRPPNSQSRDKYTNLLLERSTRSPSVVNVSELLENISISYTSQVEKQGMARAGLPYLSSANYLSTLSLYVSLAKVNRILVVTGPRGSGKSEGILAMIPAWTKLNHLVLDYNFDHIGRLEYTLAKTVVNALHNMNPDFLECYYDKMVTECGASMTFHIQAGQLFDITIPIEQGWILSTIAVLAIAVLALKPEWLGKLANFFKNMNWVVSLAILAIFIVCLAIMGIFLLSDSSWIGATESFITKYELRALVCTSSVISKCNPDQLPVLIVRQYSTEDNTMNEMFHVLKKGIGSFPIIVEAADYRWKTVPIVTKSRELFVDYQLQEMTSVEGKAQLVDKYQIWSEDEYEKVYETLGGHMGSLRLLFDYHKVLEMSLDDALSHMKEEAFSRFVHTLSLVEDKRMVLGVVNAMLNDGEANLIKLGLNLSTFMNDVLQLFNENIVFITSAGGKMYVHNRLMKFGIRKALEFYTTDTQSDN